MTKEKFYITTPIYYPSDKLHIGHSYTTVAADAMARYKRLKGYDVMFLTGTDEHGQKIQRIAHEKGMTPKAYVDGIVETIKKLWTLMKISNDRFIRTTDPDHEKTVQKIFKKLYDKGDIYKSEYEGWYCTPCESFWTETQLEEGKCPDCGRPVELMKEESYFFRLSKYQDQLIRYIEEHPAFIQPDSRRNEMMNNFLKKGLEDLCVSRTTFDWGVPVEFDPGHVVYVWIDALSNYITALGYLSEDESLFERFWPADIHLVGKEIVRFHTIIWPAMLLALELPLPKQVFGHGWLVLAGGKMSKSKGNVVDPVVLVEKYGLDAIRYFLLREVPFGSDGLFSNEALINRINADLANDLGNLVSRTVAMVDKYFDGIIPDERLDGDFDEDLRTVVLHSVGAAEECMEHMEFSTALAEIWKAVSRTNKYIDETAPWLLAKDEGNKPRLAQVMYHLVESIRIISIVIQPFLVETPGLIWEQIGLNDPSETQWNSAGQWGGYRSGNKVKKGDVMFPRIDTEKELENLDKLGEGRDLSKQKKGAKKDGDKAGEKFGGSDIDIAITPEATTETVSHITIDEFAKVELRTVTVLEAAKVKGADKLLQLKVQMGDEIRQVVSGIAKYYEPEALIGKHLILVANLKPVKIKGILSQGMILAASDEDGLGLVTVDRIFPSGTKIS